MARHIFLGLSFIVAATNLLPGQTTAPSADTSISLPHLATDAKYKFQLHFPDGWQRSTDDRPGSISVYPVKQEQPPSLMATAYPVTDLPDVHSQADLARHERTLVKRGGWQIIDDRNVPLDSGTAYELIFTATNPRTGQNAMVVDIGLLRNGLVYGISYNGTTEQIRKYLPQFNAIAASFHVDKSK